jgi:HK97 family phage major capsid protein
MKFYDFTVKPSEYAVVVYATNQVLRDTALLEQEINDNVPMELNFMLDDDILNGSAAGYPSGILNDNSLVTVAKESGQVAATIVKANILKMWSRLWSRSKSNAVWFVNQDCAPQLHNLEIGSGGSLMYRLPGSQGNESPFGTLLGRPVIETEFNATLGTVGDIVLADMSQYRLATIGSGVETASSIHVQFLTNQTAFRFTVPYDGQSSWETALTPYKGSNTVSPFVALATRS